MLHRNEEMAFLPNRTHNDEFKAVKTLAHEGCVLEGK